MTVLKLWNVSQLAQVSFTEIDWLARNSPDSGELIAQEIEYQLLSPKQKGLNGISMKIPLLNKAGVLVSPWLRMNL